MKMNRREFVGWMSMGAIATSFLSAASHATNPSEEKASSDSFQVVGTLDELETEGSLTDDLAGVIVVRNKSNHLIALDITCPHRGCDVFLREGGERLACPCHGSEFTIRGKVLQGPARTSLTNYEVKVEDNQVLVKVQ